MIYLAGPHTGCEEYSFKFLTKYAAGLVEEGHFVFSPITHCYPMAQSAGLPVDFGYWGDYNKKMLSLCDCLVVLELPGWNRSRGVNAEISLAYELGIPVYFKKIHELPSGLEVSR